MPRATNRDDPCIPTRRVLDVGNCDPDHAAVRGMLTAHFDVTVDRVMHVADAVEQMRERTYALVLFNRLVFENGGEGIELLRRAKSDPGLCATPVMMVSNYLEAQAASIAAGGEPGFGKKALHDPATVSLLGRFLPRLSGNRETTP